MNQVFVFQECHSPESFRPEGLELPHLEKWTARHRLCQPLQCPEEQWGQKYVWCRVGWCDPLWVWGRDTKAGIFLTWQINGWYCFLPDQGLQWLCSLELSSRKAEGYPLPLLRDSVHLVQGPLWWDAVTCPSWPFLRDVYTLRLPLPLFS